MFFYKSSYAKKVKCVNAAILLCWLPDEFEDCCLHPILMADVANGTGLTYCQIETARRKLRDLGVIVEEKIGSPPLIHVAVDWGILFALKG